jgi:hypothetical protein
LGVYDFAVTRKLSVSLCVFRAPLPVDTDGHSRQCQEQIQQGSEQIDVKPSYGLSDVTKIAACCKDGLHLPIKHAIACIGGAQVDADRMILATFEVHWKRRPSQFKKQRVSTDDDG